MSVIEAKNLVKIGDPFTFTCKVTNTSDRPIELEVKLVSEASFKCDYIASSEFYLGGIDPGNSKEFPLTVCPVKLGLMKVTNLVIKNLLMKNIYTFTDVVEALVVESDNQNGEAFQMNKFVSYNLNEDDFKTIEKTYRELGEKRKKEEELKKQI